jgi:hypothetical protein
VCSDTQDRFNLLFLGLSVWSVHKTEIYIPVDCHLTVHLFRADIPSSVPQFFYRHPKIDDTEVHCRRWVRKGGGGGGGGGGGEVDEDGRGGGGREVE